MSYIGDETPPKDSSDLESMLTAVNQRNTLLRRLAGSVDGLAAQVRRLRRDIDDRPTKAQAEHRRRGAVAALLVFGVLLIWGHDEHVQRCSPGATAERVLVDLANDPGPSVLTAKGIQKTIDDQQPTDRCDVSFPIHAHNPADEWPTRWNLAGFGLYAVLGGILWSWQRGPRGARESGPRDREEGS